MLLADGSAGASSSPWRARSRRAPRDSPTPRPRARARCRTPWRARRRRRAHVRESCRRRGFMQRADARGRRARALPHPARCDVGAGVERPLERVEIGAGAEVVALGAEVDDADVRVAPRAARARRRARPSSRGRSRSSSPGARAMIRPIAPSRRSLTRFTGAVPRAASSARALRRRARRAPCAASRSRTPCPARPS